MSGICGLGDLSGAPVDVDLLNEMTAALRFRGPDAEQIWHERGVGFGHALLRTTQEAQTERQPFELDGVWITADARIDGRADLLRKLRGAGRDVGAQVTEPELILHAYHAWGEACAEHLLGDFAFAIWDERRRALFCARDHFGAKPFFYAHTSSGFAFSNTLQALRLHPSVSAELDEVFIADFLCFVHSHDLERSAFKDIRRLPPAHCLNLSPEGFLVRRYWTPPIEPCVGFVRERDCLEQFQAIFDEAVRDRMRLPAVTLWLSGGLDSTAIGIAAKKSSPATQMLALTASCEKLFDDPEPALAILNAKTLGFPHRICLHESKPFQEIDAGFSRPEPANDPFNANTIGITRVGAEHSRVVLNGQGGDEVLYREMASDLLAGAGVGHTAKHLLISLLLHQRRPALGLRGYVAAHRGEGSAAQTFSVPDWIDPDLRARLGLDDRCRELNRVRRVHPTRPAGYQRVAAHTTWAWYLESLDPGFTGLPVEFRHPFLDLRLVRFLLSLPAFPWAIGKYLLRCSMKGQVPEELLRRRKTPLASDPFLSGVRRFGPQWVSGIQWSQGIKPYVRLEAARMRFEVALSTHDPSLSTWVELRPVALGIWLDGGDQRASFGQSRPYFYKFYGLAFETNAPLPMVAEPVGVDGADVFVHLGRLASDPACFTRQLFVRSRTDNGAEPLLRVSGPADGSPRYWFRYIDGVEFVVDLPERTIHASWPPHFCLEDAAVYLLGPILGFYLRLLGTVSLHASVVELDGKAVAITGPGGAGKSTLIASLGQAGFEVLNEDVAPLRETAQPTQDLDSRLRGNDNRFSVLPGYPLIRLWPSSVEHLFGSRDAMPQLTPSWDKRSWSEVQGGVNFGKEPLPLKAVYLLAPREETNAPRVEELAPREALIGLVTNTYVNYLLSPEQRAHEFELLGRLVASVPVRRLVPHADIKRLPELRECLLRDCGSL